VRTRLTGAVAASARPGDCRVLASLIGSDGNISHVLTNTATVGEWSRRFRASVVHPTVDRHQRFT